jgi:regulator of telomere elongation helicase 1
MRRSAEDGSTALYRVHLRDGDGKAKGPCLSYWCLVPGVCMRELEKMGTRSIVLTSGTLSPLESFAHELARAALRSARVP